MGTAASPIVHKDRVYIVHDNLTESFLAAFERVPVRRSGA